MLQHSSPAAVGYAALALLFSASPASAQTTLAHWNFDSGAAGLPFSSRPGYDLVGNDYLIRGYNNIGGPSYSAETPNGAGLSLHATGRQDGYTTAPGINKWSPAEWTIEVSARLDKIEGWTTIIGRDGSSSPAAAKADFYLQKDGVNNRIRLDFASVDGARYMIESPFAVTAGAWYHIALVSDNRTVAMYIDRNNGEGFQLAASTPLTGTNNALAASGANWIFGRGWYSGKPVDHIDGYLDDIRFTQGALPPSAFLHAKGAQAGAQRLEAARADQEVSLTWSLPTGSLSQLDLYRHNREDAAGRTLIATLYPPAKLYLDQVPDGGATYWYWLVATDANGKTTTFGPTVSKPAAIWRP